MRCTRSIEVGFLAVTNANAYFESMKRISRPRQRTFAGRMTDSFQAGLQQQPAATGIAMFQQACLVCVCSAPHRFSFHPKCTSQDRLMSTRTPKIQYFSFWITRSQGHMACKPPVGPLGEVCNLLIAPTMNWWSTHYQAILDPPNQREPETGEEGWMHNTEYHLTNYGSEEDIKPSQVAAHHK
jgi:hypothetical protein